MILLVERLRELLSYDPVSGDLRWRECRGPRKSGEKAGWIHRGTRTSYVRIEVDGVAVFAHVVAFAIQTGRMPTDEIDHRDGNGLNNAWLNLRSATKAQNQQNHRLRSDNTSGFMGVYPHKANGTWCASIRDGGRVHYIGSFPSPELAARARDSVARKLHGEFASLNFPAGVSE